jgi:tetratricopeptide (TPR) repeat protein
MPLFKSSDIAHTAITDHRILRKPEEVDRQRRPRQLQPGETPVVNFFERELDPHDPQTTRDRGLALIYLDKQPGPFRDQMTARAFPLLEKAVQDFPDDVPSWEAKAWALALQNRTDEALSTFATTLRKAPDRELTLALAATVADKTGRAEEATGYYHRLVALNPWMWEYRFNLGKLLAQRRDWSNAWEQCNAALELNPSSMPTRMLFITCCLQTGKHAQANNEFEKLLALYPGEERKLRDWFSRQGP